jgi:hypothetical protein
LDTESIDRLYLTAENVITLGAVRERPAPVNQTVGRGHTRRSQILGPLRDNVEMQEEIQT